MTLDEARELLSVAIAELESGSLRDLLVPLTAGARRLLETTTPGDKRTAADCADDLRVAVVALPILASGLYWAAQRQLS